VLQLRIVLIAPPAFVEMRLAAAVVEMRLAAAINPS